jgi:hypothetical protein
MKLTTHLQQPFAHAAVYHQLNTWTLQLPFPLLISACALDEVIRSTQ